MEELEGLGARGDRWTASDVRFMMSGAMPAPLIFRGNFLDGRG